ncbi:MAG: ABC transporter ATP-binding protein [Anaerolineales bacterium]
MENVIDIQGLVKWYGPVQALRGVDLKVRQGELLGFLGPNGAGKTTTIRCMLDQIRPQEGTIQVLGLDPQKNPVQVQRRTGYLPGELSLEGTLKVGQLLRYLKELRGNQIDEAYLNELTERLELDTSRTIKNLSSGNKQKVGVVQALMHQPELLILDEPTAGLDPLMQQEVYRLLREAQSWGATVFFSSHILSEVETLANRVAIIRQGVIVEEATPDQLVEMAMRRVEVTFLETVDLTPLRELEGVQVLAESDGVSAQLRVEGEMDALIKTLAKFPVKDIQTASHSLEEIFLKYYREENEEGE